MANNDVIKAVVGPQGPAGPAPSGAGNLVLATPNGSSGTATLRALVLADLPSLVIGAGTVTNFTAGTIDSIATTAVANPTTTPSLTFALSNQAANSVFAGPTSGAAAAPTFRALVTADIPTGTVLWNQIGNANGNLTLANAGFTTEFDQTSAVAWLWKNTTVATVSSTNASPLLEVAANYWTGAASAADTWTIGSALAAGTNGASTLTIAHTGSTGAKAVNFPHSGATTPALIFGGDTSAGFDTATNIVQAYVGRGDFRIFDQTDNVLALSLGQAGNGASSYISIGKTGLPLALGAISSLCNPFTANITFMTLGAAANVAYNGTAAAGLQVNISEPPTFSPASGSTDFIAHLIKPTINQTGTATGSYTGLLVNIVETALLGTTNRLLDLQAGTTGGTSQFAITNKGHISCLADLAGQVTITAASTTQAVTFAANYVGTGQPIVVITPTSDPLALGVPVGYWVTYQGGAGAWTGFTVNIQTALAGNVTFNYIVIQNR